MVATKARKQPSGKNAEVAELKELLAVLRENRVRVYKRDGLELVLDPQPVVATLPRSSFAETERTPDEQDQALREIRLGKDLRHIRGGRKKSVDGSG